MSRIHAYLQANGADHAVGVLHLNLRRGRLTSTFTYDSAYVGWAHAYAVEPALPLSNGNWSTGRSLPRSFDDAAPDRWGRNLIAKRLRAEASTAGGPLPQIDDGDYLMGVSDKTRQGALRFTTIAGGEFLHPSQDVPKLVALPALLRAADHVSNCSSPNFRTTATIGT